MDECCVAFEHLKKLLTSPPVLASPGFTKQFVLHIDANGEGLGANYQARGPGGSVGNKALQNIALGSPIHCVHRSCTC